MILHLIGYTVTLATGIFIGGSFLMDPWASGLRRFVWTKFGRYFGEIDELRAIKTDKFYIAFEMRIENEPHRSPIMLFLDLLNEWGPANGYPNREKK